MKALESLSLKKEKQDGSVISPMEMMVDYGSTISKEFAKSYMMKKKVANAQETGEIHIHDLNYMPLGTTTSSQINLPKIYDEGFNSRNLHIREPKDIMSYTALAVLVINLNQKEQHGCQSVPAFDYYMAPGVVITFKKQLKQTMDDILIYTDFDKFAATNGIEREIEKIETIVGYLPFIAEGDEVKLIGKIVEHKEYGEQFKVDSFEKLMPQSLEALERYLGNGTIKGVGPATAKKIVETFGDETLDILKYDPSKLQKVRGISSERALEIAESFMESWGVWQIVEFLKKFNIGIENAKRIYDKLGAMAIETIEENPYVLIDLVRGVNFKQIDDMALKLGIEAESLKRITSGIKYALIQISYNGHSCTILQNLEEFVINLLGISIDDVESGIIHLKAKGEIVIEDRDDDTEWVYLESFYNTEVAI